MSSDFYSPAAHRVPSLDRNVSEPPPPIRDNDYCCLKNCCGPGSWCCNHAHSHTHTSDGAAVFPSRPLGPESL